MMQQKKIDEKSPFKRNLCIWYYIYGFLIINNCKQTNKIEQICLSHSQLTKKHIANMNGASASDIWYH